MHTLRIGMILAVAVAVIALAGCGGGSSVRTPAWPEYTPPPDVVPEEQQAEFAGAQAIEPLGAVDTPAPSISPLDMTIAGLEPIVRVFWYLFEGLLPSDAGADPSASIPRSMILELVRYTRDAIVRSGETEPAAAGDVTPVDWTDPVLGIHWTGSYQETLTGYQLDLHGAGPNTDVDVDGSVTVTGPSSGHAALSVNGYVAADVEIIDWVAPECEVREGRATLDGDVTVDVEMTDDSSGEFSGSCSLESSLQVFEDDRWVTRALLEGGLDATGTLADDDLAAQGELDFYFGVPAGEGIFWARHIASAEGEYNLDTKAGWVAMTHSIELSNNMSGYAELDAAGNISGWLHDAEGEELATFSGNVYDGTAQINWADGSTTPIEWPF